MARWTDWLARAGMMLVALVLAHNLVFLATYGARYGEVLARTGHDAAWMTAVASALAIALALLVGGAWQLRRLSGLARSVGVAAGQGEPGPAAFAARLVRLWLGLAPLTALLFVAQENAEHLALGDGPPGVGVLALDGSPVAIAVIAAVALAVAFVAALFIWRRDALTARIAATRLPWSRAGREPRRPAWADRQPGPVLGRGLAVRAPPLGSRS